MNIINELETKLYFFLYFLLSGLLSFVNYSVSFGTSALNLDQLKSYFIENELILFVVAGSILLSVLWIKLSRVLIVLFTIVFSFFQLQLMNGQSSAIIITSFFFFLLVTFFIFQMAVSESREPYTARGISPFQLNNILGFKLPCQIKHNKKFYSGQLSNWSENGCYVFMDKKCHLAGNVVVSVSFNDVNFVENGSIVKSVKKNEYGIKMLSSKNDNSWLNLIGILKERQITLEFLK